MPVFRQGFGRPHQLSGTFYAYPAWPVLPLLGTCCWARIHHDKFIGNEFVQLQLAREAGEYQGWYEQTGLDLLEV